MFFPQLFGIVGKRLVCSPEQQYDDPEDLLNDRYLLEVSKQILKFRLEFDIEIDQT